jgi:hypothetical protein
MAYAQKTKAEPQTVDQFLAGITPPARQAEALRLVTLFSDVTGYSPRVYTGSMVGFGRYDYTYGSGHSGTAFATGFAPRKADLSIYVLSGHKGQPALLQRLGKHRAGKACLYLRHLSDADEGVLRDLIAAGLADLRSRWTVHPI